MEVNDLNNKLDKQSKEMLKKLGGGIEDLSNLADQKSPAGSTPVTTFPGHIPLALISAIVSSAVWCWSSVVK